jgi:acyl-CoA synthetase (AMP-forming)/AMP-acid ligase II
MSPSRARRRSGRAPGGRRRRPRAAARRKSSGRLQVRGPWVVKRYFKDEEDRSDDGGWFDTGDVAVLHPDGTMQITDRAKDVIKSGGEWISSIDLENAAVGCAGVAEAAAIGIPHPKWDERPLLLVVRSEGSEVTEQDIRDHLRNQCAPAGGSPTRSNSSTSFRTPRPASCRSGPFATSTRIIASKAQRRWSDGISRCAPAKAGAQFRAGG